MGAPKPTLGYPSRTEAVLALQAEGLTDRQIADRIGVTPKNVVSLAHAAPGAKKRTVRPFEQLGRTVVLSRDTLERLRPHAEVRGVSTNELVRRIIDVAVDDGLINGILDDQDAEEAEHG